MIPPHDLRPDAVLKESSMKRLSIALCLCLCFSVRARPIPGAPTGPASAAELQSDVDRIVGEVLASSGVPSASVAIVRQGQPAWGALTELREESRAPPRGPK